MKRKIKCFLGLHEWKSYPSRRFYVIDKDDRAEGEVTLTICECIYCNECKLHPSDRIHYEPRKRSNDLTMPVFSRDHEIKS